MSLGERALLIVLWGLFGASINAMLNTLWFGVCVFGGGVFISCLIIDFVYRTRP